VYTGKLLKQMNKINGTSDKVHSHDPASVGAAAGAAQQDRDDAIATAATVGVVAVGAIIFEAALLPGLILGVAAALAPKYLPKVGSALNPLFRSSVRGAYRFGQKSREAFAEAQEHMHDIAAEVNAADEAKTKAKAAAGAPEADTGSSAS
jgi:hypothetical protein